LAKERGKIQERENPKGRVPKEWKGRTGKGGLWGFKRGCVWSFIEAFKNNIGKVGKEKGKNKTNVHSAEKKSKSLKRGVKKLGGGKAAW